MGATAGCRGFARALAACAGERTAGSHPIAAPHRICNSEKTHEGTIKVNEMWGTGMSQTVTAEEGRVYVFVAVEHANSETVGIQPARAANRFEPVRRGASVLRLHRRRGAWAQAASRPWL
jgi:hypothetical protein